MGKIAVNVQAKPAEIRVGAVADKRFRERPFGRGALHQTKSLRLICESRRQVVFLKPAIDVRETANYGKVLRYYSRVRESGKEKQLYHSYR